MFDSADTESRYRDGMALWIDGDRDRAIVVLEAALENSAGPRVDAWWHSISRALARIAIQVDDLERAEWHLRCLPHDGVGIALTQALRGRHRLTAGDALGAAGDVVAATAQLSEDPADDDGSLMNGAIALAWCAEVLAELGYGPEAATAVDAARERVSEAGIEDPVVEEELGLADAAAARLIGESDRATDLLAAIDTATSTDSAVRVARERARLAWDAGDLTTARGHYDRAIADAEAGGYVSQGRLIAAERTIGPPRPRRGLAAWVAERARREREDLEPYAVVIRLVGDERPDRFTGLVKDIDALLRAAPSPGSVDGTGSDGRIWELFLNGDDPDALWAAVRPLVDNVGPAHGSDVQVRRGDAVETELLA